MLPPWACLRWREIALGCLLAALCGCRGGDPLISVEGRVMMDDVPLPHGSVSLRPDTARGNTSREHPTGSIGDDGRYRVYTGGLPGAPPGWYRVVVFSSEDTTPSGSVHPSLPKSLIDPRYNDERRTPLSVEVRADAPAGAFDLQVKAPP